MNDRQNRLSYTTEEAAEVTGLPRTAIYHAIKSQDLQSFKVGRRRMVSVGALQKFIASKEKQAGARAA